MEGITMKNFDGWYGPEIPEIATDLDDWCEYQGMKKGWKAALEWALSEGRYCGNWWSIPIEEELNGD